MAFNWQTFRIRTITSVIFVAVMLAGLLWNEWSFLVLFSIIHFGCWWEYLKLMEKIHNTLFHPYIKLGFMVLGYGSMLWFCGPAYQVSDYGLKENFSLPVSAAGFGLLVIGIFQRNKIPLRSFGAAASGLLYISLSLGLLTGIYVETDIHIHDTVYIVAGKHLPLIILISIWANDTMAYLVGSMIGKTSLSKISPKKTWEGTIGGIILSIVIVGMISYYALHLKWLTTPIIIIAAITAITGTFGDLFESKLKRIAAVKDSGSIMPGHGGFLDRFDSLLIATPCVWFCIKILFS